MEQNEEQKDQKYFTNLIQSRKCAKVYKEVSEEEWYDPMSPD